MADGNQRIYQGRADAAQALLVEGLPPCIITVTADGTWHVTAQLAAGEQAALAAAVTHPDTLCQRAQHALGLAGIGSRIAPEYTAIGVYTPGVSSSSGTILLVLEGRAMLCWVSRARSDTIQALIAAATEVMRSVCRS